MNNLLKKVWKKKKNLQNVKGEGEDDDEEDIEAIKDKLREAVLTKSYKKCYQNNVEGNSIERDDNDYNNTNITNINQMNTETKVVNVSKSNDGLSTQMKIYKCVIYKKSENLIETEDIMKTVQNYRERSRGKDKNINKDDDESIS